jgi:glycosyltransferase involved in cell wall biosynthesis
MKTACVTLDYAEATGGSAESVRQFAAALGGLTISFTSASLLDQCIRKPDVEHIPVPDTRIGRTYGWPEAAACRRAEGMLQSVDFIFCHKLFRFHNDWVRRISRRIGVPYCVVPHGSLDPYVFTYRRLRKSLWMGSFGKKCFDRAAGFVFATERERKKAEPYVGSRRSWVVHWPVPHFESPDPMAARNRTRAMLGIAPDDRLLLFLGRLHSMKRPLETITSFGRATIGGAHLVIAGPADEYTVADLESFARNHGIYNVHVIGPVYGPEKWDLYHSADGFINLSARENFGFTVAEALAAGLPVILSPGNDLAADLRRNSCGWFLDDDREEAAAKAVGSFLAAPAGRLREMGSCGRKWALDNASMGQFRSRLLGLMKEVTGHE